jgi:acyl carrier protein
MAVIQKRIADFFLNDEDLAAVQDIATDESLVTSGLIDSIGILKLVAFIEEEFDIELDADDVNVANFDTLESIAKLIETHLKK